MRTFVANHIDRFVRPLVSGHALVGALLSALPASGSTTAVPAQPLYAERIGTGDRAVVVLPGLLGSTRYWHGSGLERLALSYTVLRFGARVIETDNDHRHYAGAATMLIVQELDHQPGSPPQGDSP